MCACACVCVSVFECVWDPTCFGRGSSELFRFKKESSGAGFMSRFTRRTFFKALPRSTSVPLKYTAVKHIPLQHVQLPSNKSQHTVPSALSFRKEKFF